MTSLILQLVLVYLFAAILTSGVKKDSNFKCKENVQYQQDKCNFCNCRNGRLACTMKACGNAANCTRGTAWKEGCEQCWCTEMGSVCTVNCGNPGIASSQGNNVIKDVSVPLGVALSLRLLNHLKNTLNM